MAATIYTDSSDYSEDFEDSANTPPEPFKYSEQDVFPNLFDYLEATFNSDRYLNYEIQETPLDLAVGKFLTKAQNSKADILGKVAWEYLLKKKSFNKKLMQKKEFLKFPKILKSLFCFAKCESEFLYAQTKKMSRRVMEDVRTKVVLSVGVVEKDKMQAKLMLDKENAAIGKKSQELQENFYWIRFTELLKGLIPSKIKFSVPGEKKKNIVKAVVESFFKQVFVVKNVMALEDSDFQNALGNKRILQQATDRRIEVSELCTDSSKIPVILNEFLKFTSKPQPKPQQNPYPAHMLLCRSCNFYLVLNLQRPTTEESLSLLLFFPLYPEKLFEKFRNFDLTSIEDDIKSYKSSLEITNFTISGTELTVALKGENFILRAATVEDLSQLPTSPLKKKVTSQNNLFTLSQESFYTTRTSPIIFLRVLSESEINELYNVYFYRKQDGIIPNECFPDINKNVFKYKYVVLKDSVLLSAGVFSKHWLVQMKPNELKRSVSDGNLLKMCKWEGCMSALVAENCMAKMISEFNLLTNKAKNVAKKGLSPLKRSRTASEAVMFTDLCIFHNNLRNILRNQGLSVKNFVYDHSCELWKASQSGDTWLEQLSDNNKISELRTGVTKSALLGYFADFYKGSQRKKQKNRGKEGALQGQKEALLREIENLKVRLMQKLKESEIKCTKDLKRIRNCGVSSGFLKVIES